MLQFLASTLQFNRLRFLFRQRLWRWSRGLPVRFGSWRSSWTFLKGTLRLKLHGVCLVCRVGRNEGRKEECVKIVDGLSNSVVRIPHQVLSSKAKEDSTYEPDSRKHPPTGDLSTLLLVAVEEGLTEAVAILLQLGRC